MQCIHPRMQLQQGQGVTADCAAKRLGVCRSSGSNSARRGLPFALLKSAARLVFFLRASSLRLVQREPKGRPHFWIPPNLAHAHLLQQGYPEPQHMSVPFALLQGPSFYPCRLLATFNSSRRRPFLSTQRYVRWMPGST